MTFLELCQRLRLEAGVSGTGPVSVLNQAGSYEKLVKWVQAAYEDIQNEHDDWFFLQTEFSFSTISGVQNYTKTAVGLDELRNWKMGQLGDIRIYSSVSDETWLEYIPWDEFRANYLIGTSRTSQGRPSVFSIKPDMSMSLWQTPDAVYTVNGEYFKRAQTLTTNTSEPIFPQQYHMMIVWRALMYYAAKTAADEKYAHGQNEYRRLLNSMEQEMLPQIGYGAPLV